MDTQNLETALKNASGLIDQKLGEVLVVPDAPEGRVIEAMKYTLMGGGKRLRAFYVSKQLNYSMLRKPTMPEWQRQ